MKLERCKDQGSQTLEEFYEELSRDSRHQSCAEAMLALIARLRALPDERQVWGLTSLLRLVLLHDDTYLAPWSVIIHSHGSFNFSIEYLMPAAVAPWPNAFVRGEALSADDALHMILIAMERAERGS